MEYFFDEPCSH
jgi:hypothetical protein